jgi:hypothetical protein
MHPTDEVLCRSATSRQAHTLRAPRSVHRPKSLMEMRASEQTVSDSCILWQHACWKAIALRHQIAVLERNRTGSHASVALIGCSTVSSSPGGENSYGALPDWNRPDSHYFRRRFKNNLTKGHCSWVMRHGDGSRRRTSTSLPTPETPTTRVVLPRSCPLYEPGPPRKVPGRQGLTYTEKDWVDIEATSHRRLDE